MVSTQDRKALEALPDSKEILLKSFGNQTTTNKDSVTLFNRETTEKGSPINKTFNLGFKQITQAVLKVNLLADEGKILGFIDNAFKLKTININGRRFTPSDPRSSINIIERVNDASLQKLLIPDGQNEISIEFDAPIGAGVISPSAEITAILILHGVNDPFKLSGSTNITEVTKDIQSFVRDNTGLTIGIGVFIIVALILITIIVVRFGSAKEATTLVQAVKS